MAYGLKATSPFDSESFQDVLMVKSKENNEGEKNLDTFILQYG